MRKKTKEILTRGLACFAAIELTFFSTGIDVIKALAKNKSQNKSETVYFWSMEGGNGVAALACAAVEVYLSETEYYSTKGNTVTYTSRSTYAHAKPTVGSWSSIWATPGAYYSNQGKVTNTFSYSNADGLFPGGSKFIYCKENKKNVSLSKNNNKYARAHVTVGVSGTLNPTKVVTVTNYLAVC